MTYFPAVLSTDPSISWERHPTEDTVFDASVRDMSPAGIAAYISLSSTFMLGVLDVSQKETTYRHFPKTDYRSVVPVWVEGTRWLLHVRREDNGAWEFWESLDDLASVVYVGESNLALFGSQLYSVNGVIFVPGHPAFGLGWMDVSVDYGRTFTSVHWNENRSWATWTGMVYAGGTYWIQAMNSVPSYTYYASSSPFGPFTIAKNSVGAFHVFTNAGNPVAFDDKLTFINPSTQELLSLPGQNSNLSQISLPGTKTWTSHSYVWDGVFLARSASTFLFRGEDEEGTLAWREIVAPGRPAKCVAKTISALTIRGQYALGWMNFPSEWLFMEGLPWGESQVVEEVILPPAINEEWEALTSHGCVPIDDLSPRWIGDWFQAGNGIVVSGPASRGSSLGDLLHVLDPATQEVLYSRMPTTGEAAYNRAFCGWVGDRWLIAAQRYDAANPFSCTSSWECGEWELWESFDNLISLELIGPAPCPVHQIYYVQGKVVLLPRYNTSSNNRSVWLSEDAGKNFTSVLYCRDYDVFPYTQEGQATNVVWAHDRVWIKANAGVYTSELRLFSSSDWETFVEFDFGNEGDDLAPRILWGQSSVLTVVDGKPTLPCAVGCAYDTGRYVSIVSPSEYELLKFPVNSVEAELTQIFQWGNTYVALERDWDAWPVDSWIHTSLDLVQWHRTSYVGETDFSSLVVQGEHLLVQNNYGMSFCFFTNEDIAPYLVEANCWVSEGEGEQSLEWRPEVGFSCTSWDEGLTIWDGGNTDWDCGDSWVVSGELPPIWAEEDSLMCTQLVEWSGDN